MKIQFTGMLENYYKSEGKDGRAGSEWVTFLDREQKGGKIKLASSDVDLSSIPYLEMIEVTAEVKGTPGSKPGSFNLWVLSLAIRPIGAVESVSANPKTKGGE